MNLTASTKPPARAFTLIELLIVVAIIAILAAIAVPNFLEAHIRAKVSRAKTDMRSAATATEAYAVDYGTYPRDANLPTYTGLVALTTPVAYIASVPRDVFNKGLRNGLTGTYTPDAANPGSLYFEMGTGARGGKDKEFPASFWAMASYGPDIDDDTEHIADFPFTGIATPYDPTNGTVSSGDIYRFGKREHPNFKSDANPIAY
jgi:prepilin-type N-terminal cleavage/methylation domain-containing protein